jgi:hypothetical protein
MAYQHGVNRIKRFGLGIAVVGTWLMVPLSPIPLYAGTGLDDGYFAAFVFLFSLPLFFGGVVHLFAWIVEGLLRPSAEYR